MKKQTLLLVFVAVSMLATAQVKPSFGIRAGLSSSGMRGDAANSLKNIAGFTNGMVTAHQLTGFFAGGYATIPFTAIISVEPAFYFSQKGYGLKAAPEIKGAGFLSANAEAQLKAQYIDFPVVVKANIKRFQIFAGPQVSYLMQANLHTTAGALGINLLNTKMGATGQFSRWDAAVTGGIGYQLVKGVNVMAAYDYGLLKADANRSIKSYNQSFKIGAGISF